MRSFAIATFVMLLAIQPGAGGALAQGVPADAAAELRAVVENSRRQMREEETLTRSMRDPYLAETRRRQAAQRAETDIIAAVNRNGARFPNQVAAIGEEAARLMPEYADRIRANVQATFPGTARSYSGAVRSPARPGSVAQAQQPAYAPGYSGYQPGVTPTAAAPVMTYSGYPNAAASIAPPPVSLYNQPILQRYSGNYAAPGSSPYSSMGASTAQYTPGSGRPTMKGETITGGGSAIDVWDPLEPMNRIFHSLNQVFDTFLLRPLAWSFGQLPTGVKTAVGRAVDNTRHPTIFVNKLLQGEVGQAGNTLVRFVVNSTVGIGGLLDPSEIYLGMPYSDADFGQTLYRWGLGAGPYLELPALGPSNTRDTVGRVADAAMSPWGYILGRGESMVMSAPRPIVVRERYMTMIDELREGSVDFYVSLRDTTQQVRAAELRGKGKAPDGGKELDDVFKDAK